MHLQTGSKQVGERPVADAGRARRRRTAGLLGALLVLTAQLAPGAPAPDAVRTRELLAVAQTSPELAARARALQQLALVATPEAVPVVAGWLGDEKLGQYARDVLEQMPDPAADEALRVALGNLTGRPLVGVVNSIGQRRNAQAVPALGQLVKAPAVDVACAALLALGRIGTPEALRLVEAALAGGTAEHRAAAAEAGVIAAERWIQGGNPTAAPALLEKVQQADVPAVWQVTATRWIIVAGGARELPRLVANLRSTDPDRRDMALRVARDLGDRAVTTALVAEMEHLSPPLQAAVIAVLVDRRDAAAWEALERRARSGAEEVRVAALQALGPIGRATSLPILLEAARPGAGAAVSAAAFASLARFAGPDADTAILAALPGADGATQVRLIGVLGDRRAEKAGAELMRLAAGDDVEIAKAAFRALGLISGPAQLPRLIELVIATKDEELKTLADRAVVTTAMKVLEPERRAEAVLRAFQTAPNPATQAALLRPLGAIMRTMGPSHEVFFAVRAALGHGAPEVRTAALTALAEWPDATPTLVLLDVAADPKTAPAQREAALRGAIRMAANVAAGRERSPLNVLEALARANRAVRTRPEKMLLVASLGSVKRIEAVQMLQPYLDDPEVGAEAALAVVQAAAGLPAGRSAAELKTVLARIAATGPDEDVRRRAARLAEGGAALAPKGKAAKAASAVASEGLFNGKDLGEWDGDPGVWRVRGGVIVGGSPDGNPRNEFLATRRRYGNFVLRLEYKLTGTEGFVNGGVQFRSVRVAQPPNEMSGYQADIGAGHSGCLYDESRRKKFLQRAADEQIKRLEKPGDWNRYEIRCEGRQVELALNGERTVTYTEEDGTVAMDGLIALQIHGNCKAEIAFRNLVIEILP